MKSLLCIIPFLLLSALASSLSAQIYADIQTTEGSFSIELDYVNTPQTTANFIGLATGSKRWIDSTTGAVRSGVPYYEGIIFHRVIAGFMNQTGSQKGDGSDGPGYTFPDELVTSDFTESYRVAMANSGPNTNGSQFFITVTPTTHLNDVHTVFGHIPEDDGPGGIIDGSRAVIDAINTVAVTNDKPDTDVVIQSIQIRRVGAEALTFNEDAVNLPNVSGAQVAIEFTGNSSEPSLIFEQEVGSTLHLGLSPDLATWSSVTRYLDADAPATLPEFAVGDYQIEKNRHFYQVSQIKWPSDAVFPDSLANRTLILMTAVDSSTPFTFTFDANGVTGTWSYPRDPEPLSGEILNSETYTLFAPNGYGARLILSLSGINYNIWVLQLGLDSDTPSNFSGRNSATAYSTIQNLNPLDVSGSFEISR